MTNTTITLTDYCLHLAPCMNVMTGRACALDTMRVNAYTGDGLPIVRNLATGTEWIAINPYTGAPSGMRGAAVSAWRAR